MKTMRILGLIIVLLMINASGAAAIGHLPEYFEIAFPEEGGRTLINDLSGSGSWSGLGATWTINDYSAEITFNGTYFYEMYDASFIIMWYSLGETMPLSVEITTDFPSEYRIVPAFQPTSEDPVDDSMAQLVVSGDTYFGHYFPDAYMTYFRISLLDAFAPYVMTITMNWGTGVPNEPATWGQVKSLYR